MPRLRNRRMIGRREWSDSDRIQLVAGYDFFGDAFGDHDHVSRTRPEMGIGGFRNPAALELMRQAWEDLRDELMEEYVDQPRRPFAYYVFDLNIDPEEVPQSVICAGVEAEFLDERGELTPAALESLRQDSQVTRGVINEAHTPPFTRTWGWWRFLSPERRDKEFTEAAQLVSMHEAGLDVLTAREKFIVGHRADMPVYAKGCSANLRLSRIDCKALGLGDEFCSDD